MQRYKVNHRLLIKLGITALVLAVAAFFTWSWQVNRKATWFLDSAESAQAEGDYQAAFEQLHKFVQFRSDEDEPRIKLANMGLKILEDKTASRELQSQAYGILQETVRRTNDSDLRYELAKLMQTHRPQDALVHVDALLAERGDDPELLEMKIRLMIRVEGARDTIDFYKTAYGYDESTGQLTEGPTKAKDRPDIYAMLATLIIQEDEDDEELAGKVIDQMIEENPDAARSYLNQSVFLRMIEEEEEADEALAKAFEIDPDDLDVLRQKAVVAFDDEDYELAEETARSAIEKHPDAIILYDFLARVLIQQEKV